MFLGRERIGRLLLDEDSMERAAAETLAGLRVTTVRSIRQPVATLSGGQRQAVAVAKAVMWNSKLVMLDEPTAALGVAQTRMVLDLIKRLKDHGLAVMVISHNLNDVFEVADRIAVLRLGRMVAQDTISAFDRAERRRLHDDRAARPRRGRRPAARRRSSHDAGTRPTRSRRGPSTPSQPPSCARPDRRRGRRRPAGDRRPVDRPVPAGVVGAGPQRRRRRPAGRRRPRRSSRSCSPIVSPNHVFLSPANLVNLFDQSAVFIVLAMGEGFVLLLGEIDLSIGYVAAIGGIVAATLVQPDPNWPWWIAIIVAPGRARALIGLHPGPDHHPPRHARPSS